MKIILRKDIDKLGRMGDVVNVKDGYARNYLIPNSFAFLAKEGAMKRIEVERRQHANVVERIKIDATNLATKITDLQVSIPMKVGEASQLYGSVTNQIIATALSELGYNTIEKHHIILDEPIKSLGIFDIKVKLHPEVSTNIKVWVISEEEN